MKKGLALMLLIALILNLCACGTKNGNEIQSDKSTSNKPEEYWQVKITQLYPLGAKGQVEAMAICEKYIFVVGQENQRFSLVRVPYHDSNGKTEFETPQQMETPDTSLSAKVVGASANEEKLAVLVEVPTNEEMDNFIYEVWLYNMDGTFDKCISLDNPFGDTPFNILVLPNNTFGITSNEVFLAYSFDGGQAISISLPRNNFLPAVLVDDMVVLQSTYEDNENATPYCVDFVSGTLLPVDNAKIDGVNISTCKSMIADAIMNNGAKIISVDKSFSCEELFDWYDLTGDYGCKYSYVFQLNESGILALNANTMILEYIDAKYARDTRETIKIAVYGHSQDSVDQLSRKLDKVKPEYRLELLCYGNDERGLTQMVSDLSSNNPPDLIISEGYLINNALGFVDLYTLIDEDPELCRDDFLPVVLKGLERGGELPQIWTSFGLFSAIAKGQLAYGPTPLKLSECQAFLDEQGYTDPLFDEYITRENLLSLLADNIIHTAWNKENNSCNLESQEIRNLIDLCLARPVEYDFSSTEPMLASEVLSWRDISLEYLSYMEHEEIAYRFFLGDGDGLSQIAAYYNSCYMIPEKCQDIEKSWSFLRELLMADYQLQMCANGFSGFPSNLKAFDEVVNAFLPDGGRDGLISAIEGAAFSGYEMVQMRNIFVEKLKPYIYGNSSYEAALKNAQSSINIFFSEHMP